MRRFPQLVPVEPGMDGVEFCERARKFWANDWSGQSFMAVGMKDVVLGPDVMAELRSTIKAARRPWRSRKAITSCRSGASPSPVPQ